MRDIIPGKPHYNKSKNNNTLIYSYTAEIPPNPKMRIKIEINTKEHLVIDGINYLQLNCESAWFKGNAAITTFTSEELLATKLRAL